MLTAIIENESNTLVMEFPCKRYLMADHLGSIGIRKPAHEIKCVDEEDEPIKVKIFGNSEFENFSHRYALPRKHHVRVLSKPSLPK